MDDVFAHGMLGMAYLAQMLTRWAPQGHLRSWNVRFTAITPLHATLHSRGEVAELFEEDGERRARLKIGAWKDNNVQTHDGERSEEHKSELQSIIRNTYAVFS